MKLSQLGIGVTRLQNIDETFPAQDILLQSGQLIQFGTGIYAYNNVPLKVKSNLERIIKNTLDENGCIEISLPTLQPKEIWEESGRWEKYVSDGTMLTVDTQKGTFCLAPTAEEAVVKFAKTKLKSYKDVPTIFYQIGEKYRNELRARGFLLRGKTFPMMDAYSFNKNEQDLIQSYEHMRNAYIQIFEKLGLEVVPVAADSGAIGGKKSEEFMLLSDIGEDTILYDKSTKKAVNTEILQRPDYEEYLKEEYGIENVQALEKRKAVELGHIFQLGTKYSQSMDASYVDKDGKEKNFYMGCYGIGVSRTLATIYEQNILRDKNNKPVGIALPTNIAPYLIQIIPKIGNKHKEVEANALYEVLKRHGIDAILDDRQDGSFGSKIRDCKILGTPYIAILGERTRKGEVEVEDTRTGEKIIISQCDLVKQLKTLKDSINTEGVPKLGCFQDLKEEKEESERITFDLEK